MEFKGTPASSKVSYRGPGNSPRILAKKELLNRKFFIFLGPGTGVFGILLLHDSQ